MNEATLAYLAQNAKLRKVELVTVRPTLPSDVNYLAGGIDNEGKNKKVTTIVFRRDSSHLRIVKSS